MERSDVAFYKEFEEKFTAFAQTREDIRAAFIIGSRARADHPAGEWSDLDLVLYTTTPDYYLQRQDWLDGLGVVLCSCVFQTAGNDPERLNLFQGGWQVDVVIHPAELLCKLASQRKSPNNFLRGVRVLVDKDHLSQWVLPPQFQPPQSTPVSEQAYRQVVTLFWFGVLYMAKQLLRGELWVAKMRDGEVKGLLLQMMEWKEKALHGNGYDTWHGGRFLSQWADGKTQQALSQCFGRYNPTDSWEALLATMELFQELSQTVGQTMGYSRPEELEAFVSGWIQEKTGMARLPEHGI